MPIVFTKSPLVLALGRLLCVVVALLVGGAFASVFFLADDPALIVSIAAGLAILCSLWMVFKLLGEAVSILKKGQEWRVEITSDQLSWHSPVPEIMQSFSIPLTSIRTLRRVYTRYKNSNRSPSNAYFIELLDGNVIELNEQTSGIAPLKVFKALEEKSVNFIEDTKVVGSKVKISS